MIFIGIDPGVTGAWAAITDAGEFLACEDLPITRHGKLAWVDGSDLAGVLTAVRGGRTTRIAIERTQPMPAQGVVSTFTGGVVLGSILAAVQQLVAPIELVSPAQWKRAMGLDADKGRSLDKARLLFPTASLDRKKDHNRAEALCLAEYLRTQHYALAAA